MRIVEAIYTTKNNKNLTATLDTEEEWHMPALEDCQTWHRSYLEEFLNDGGVINPYKEPPEVKEQPEISPEMLKEIMDRLASLENSQ